MSQRLKTKAVTSFLDENWAAGLLGRVERSVVVHVNDVKGCTMPHATVEAICLLSFPRIVGGCVPKI